MVREVYLLFVFVFVTGMVHGQQTVFALLRKDVRLAEEYYREGNYIGALQVYENAFRKAPSDRDLLLKIGECNFQLKQYVSAIRSFDTYQKDKRNLPWDDLYLYAEAQSCLGHYDKAMEFYRKYLVRNQDDEWIIRKIWRLSNIQYVYEDSSHFALRQVSVNTAAGELCAVPYKDGIVYTSNRKTPELVDKINASTGSPFYKMYFSKALPDTASRKNGTSRYGKAILFGRTLSSRYHAGPAIFYDHFRKMIFVSTAEAENSAGHKHLQLFFAEMKNGEWDVTQPFAFNSTQHSISDPAISPDGKILYFSSDMKGGFGGRDLYKSEWVNGTWTRPENLGEVVNTPYDEVFPYLHKNLTLYFSSNGHAGMGGLDIFKSAVKADGYGEAENAGFPLNSHADDFGITIDSLDTHGYISSNRNHGGFDDDIFEFDMDLQTYPLTIAGTIKIKEHTWSDSSALKRLPHAKVYLVDNLRDVTVYESATDAGGNFSVVIPYFSKYVVRVVTEDGDENLAVLEIPKHRKELSAHEIVMVRDVFKSTETPDVK